MKKKIAILFLLIVSMSFMNQFLMAATNPNYPTSLVGDDWSMISGAISSLGKTLLNPIVGLAAAIMFGIEAMLNLGFQRRSRSWLPVRRLYNI